jgi:hypothetical protein
MATQVGHLGSDRDVYTQDFIDEAILRVIEGRRVRGEAYRSLRAVCRELDVPKTTLLRWGPPRRRPGRENLPRPGRRRRTGSRLRPAPHAGQPRASPANRHTLR